MTRICYLNGLQRNVKDRVKNLPYRYQLISKNIINDSKSTTLSQNMQSTMLICCFKMIISICCGDPKEKLSKIKISGPAKILIYGHQTYRYCISHPNKYLFDDANFLLEYLQNKSIFLTSYLTWFSKRTRLQEF